MQSLTRQTEFTGLPASRIIGPEDVGRRGASQVTEQGAAWSGASECADTNPTRPVGVEISRGSSPTDLDAGIVHFARKRHGDIDVAARHEGVTPGMRESGRTWSKTPSIVSVW